MGHYFLDKLYINARNQSKPNRKSTLCRVAFPRINATATLTTVSSSPKRKWNKLKNPRNQKQKCEKFNFFFLNIFCIHFFPYFIDNIYMLDCCLRRGYRRQCPPPSQKKRHRLGEAMQPLIFSSWPIGQYCTIFFMKTEKLVF